MSHSGMANGKAGDETAGSMRTRFELTDWSQTSLGPRAHWDPALSNAVAICLDSHYPLLVMGGPELVCIYNDAAILLLDGKHPAAFACPARDVWPETWNEIGPMLEGVQQTGQAVRHDDLPLLVRRAAGEQMLYFTFSYSPVTNAAADVVAVFVVSLETTARVVQERRLRMLNQLAGAIASAKSVDQTFEKAAQALLSDPQDLPLSALYMCEHSGEMRLAFLAGQARDIEALPPCLPEREEADTLHGTIRRSLKSGQAELFKLATPLRVGEHTLAQAVALPISLPGALTTQGVFVVGLNALLPWDDDYHAFLTVVLGHLGTGLAANEAAQETSSFLSIVFDNAPSGIAIADANGMLIRANDAYARLFARHKDELAGSPMRHTYATGMPPDRQTLQHLLEQAAASSSRQTRYARSDDGDVWVAEQMSLVKDSRGQPKFVVVTTKDITETVRAQQEAQAAQEELRRLYERLQTIREEERVAIAREVHDQLGQVLTAAKIDIDLLEESLARRDGLTPEAMLSELHSAQSALDRALQLVKGIASELRAARLQEEGLFAAVRWHAHDFEQRTRTRCEVIIAEGLPEPEGEVAVTLLRIMQEGLTNVLRHASASEVVVSFHARGDAVKLRVRDNGVGIGPGAARDPIALGIRGMRERAALHRGRMVIGACKPRGSLLSVVLPRAAEGNAPAL